MIIIKTIGNRFRCHRQAVMVSSVRPFFSWRLKGISSELRKKRVQQKQKQPVDDQLRDNFLIYLFLRAAAFTFSSFCPFSSLDSKPTVLPFQLKELVNMK